MIRDRCRLQSHSRVTVLVSFCKLAVGHLSKAKMSLLQVAALEDSLRSRSALLKHEVAYVLGQVQDRAAIDALEYAPTSPLLIACIDNVRSY